MAWTGRSTGEEMWRYYDEVEEALKIAGPVNYPWGPPRPRYPYRAHEVNAAGLVLARGCEALGVKWAPTPLATISAPRGQAHPCVYRGFCTIGCSTNAKQSALVTWIPRAIRAGAEIRDLAMVGRIEIGADGPRHRRALPPRGTVALPAGAQRRGRRLCDRDAAAAAELRLPANFPDGLANSCGLVGKNLMVQSNHGVYGTFEEEIRWYKGPPSLAITEHWNYTDTGKDFPGGYVLMSQGPLPIEWADALTGSAASGAWNCATRWRNTIIRPG